MPSISVSYMLSLVPSSQSSLFSSILIKIQLIYCFSVWKLNIRKYEHFKNNLRLKSVKVKNSPVSAESYWFLFKKAYTNLHVILPKPQVLVNEAIVPIEACKGAEICPLETFLCYYNNTVRNCDAEFKRLCSLPLTGGVSGRRLSMWATAQIFTMYFVLTI